MVPEFPDLRPLELDDHAMLVEHLGGTTPVICDLIPATLFIWRDRERPSVTRVWGSLCLLIEPQSEPAYFLEPIGGHRLADAARCCVTRIGRISRARRALVDALPPDEFDVRPLRDYFDYTYLTQVLAELKGKKFDGKRNQVRKFVSSSPDYEFRPLDRSRFGSAMRLFASWAEGRERAPTVSHPSLSVDDQRRALERAFQAYEHLGLVGGAMIVRGELQGFIIASTGFAETAVVHFQYANADIGGIYQALLMNACRRLFAGCAYVNLEEDLGIPGLRKTKLSYRPLRLEEKYEIRHRGK